MSTVVQTKVAVPGATEVYPHRGCVTRRCRNERHGHRSGVVWLTGLSGAGKSTVASAVEAELFEAGWLITVLDGDTLRAGLNSDLDFSAAAREENLRRAGEVALLLAEAGYVVLATFISPHQAGREAVRRVVGDDFHLVHVRARLEDCIARDPKGLYRRALAGAIPNFTGIGQAYEEPPDADLILDTSGADVETCRHTLAGFIRERFAL